MDGFGLVAVEPADVLATLRRCAAVGPFFALDIGPAEDAWQPGAALLEPTEELAAAIEAVRRCGGGSERRVAASLFFMSYTGRLLSAAVAGVLLGGVLLDLRAERLLWRYRPGAGLQLRMTSAAGWRAGAPELAGQAGPAGVPESAGLAGLAGRQEELLAALVGGLVRGSLAATVRAVRGLVPVSARLLWGNAASSLVGALGALAATGAVPADECRAAGDRLLAARPLAGAGHFRRPPGQPGQLDFRRRTCCLFYRLPSGGKCADCVLLPD